MPDKFGNLVNVVADDENADTSQQSILPTLPDFIGEATQVGELNKVNMSRGREMIRNTQVSMQQDLSHQQKLTSEVNDIYGKLSKDRWIDYVFGEDYRRVLGLFDDDYNDQHLSSELLKKQKQIAQTKDNITSKRNVINTARGLVKDAAQEARAAATSRRAAITAQSTEMKKIVENADFEQLRVMLKDPRFKNYRGLVQDELYQQAESYVEGLPEQQVLQLALKSKDPVLKAAAEARQNNIIGIRLDNQAKQELVKQRQLGNTKTTDEIVDFRRENVLSRASAPVLRKALAQASKDGYGVISDMKFAMGDLQAALTNRIEQRNKFKDTEIEHFDVKFDTSNQVLQGDVTLQHTDQAEIQLPVGDVTEFQRFKAMAGNEQLMNTHGPQVLAKGKEIVAKLEKAKDAAVKAQYPTKQGQAAAHDFLDNGQINNGSNAAYMLTINNSPNMGAREGGALEGPMSTLRNHLLTKLDSSFINNGEVDLDALIKDTKFKPEDLMANYIQESGARTQAMAGIATNYFFDSVKRFEKENQQAAGISTVRTDENGRYQLDSTTYLYNLYKVTGDDTLVKKFIASYGDSEAQQAWSDTFKSNLNIQEAAALKLFTDNRVKNILVKQQLQMDNPQKAALVKDRYEQDLGSQRRTQENTQGYLNRIRDAVDRLVETGLDEKYIETRIKEQARAFNFNESGIAGLRSYIRLRTAAEQVGDNPTEQSMIMQDAENAWLATTQGLSPNMGRM